MPISFIFPFVCPSLPFLFYSILFLLTYRFSSYVSYCLLFNVWIFNRFPVSVGFDQHCLVCIAAFVFFSCLLHGYLKAFPFLSFLFPLQS